MRMRRRYKDKRLTTALFAVAFIASFGLETPPAAAEGLISWLFGEQSHAQPAREGKQRAQSASRVRVASIKPMAPHRALKAAAPKVALAKPSPTKVEPALAPAPVAKADVADPSIRRRPLFAIVSIASQHVSIYNHDGLVTQSPVSTGMEGHATPRGIFTIIGRERFHASNIYSGAPMPFMQRITWSGIAMHVGVVPGHPASHGCIRLPASFAERLWGMTKIGERVMIAPSDALPMDFSHAALPTPKLVGGTEVGKSEPTPAGETASPAKTRLVNPLQLATQNRAKAAADRIAATKAEREASTAAATKRAEAAQLARDLRTVEAALKSARDKAATAVKNFEAASATVSTRQRESVLAAAELTASESNAINKAKAYRLAEAYEAALEARDASVTGKSAAEAVIAPATAKFEDAKKAAAAKDVEVGDAERRVHDAATAVETAKAAEKEAILRETPISILVSKKDKKVYVRQGLTPIFDAPATIRDPDQPLGSHLFIATAADEDGSALKWTAISFPGAATAAGPDAALDRIELAQDVRDKIAERLWIGGSFIVTDQGPSDETGAIGTDLTVKVR
jgi:lipoprotein-anchoring transpeptidase ErfK/SrfK